MTLVLLVADLAWVPLEVACLLTVLPEACLLTVEEEFLTALPRPLLALWATLALLLPESTLLRARLSRTATLLSFR